MQSSNSIQIQDIQRQVKQGFCAVVHEPTAYLADIDVHSCSARPPRRRPSETFPQSPAVWVSIHHTPPPLPPAGRLLLRFQTTSRHGLLSA